jgi:hypothetical protein
VDWWSVTVESRADGTGQVDDDATARLLDLTAPYSGRVRTSGELARWTATIDLEAASAADAVADGVRLLAALANDAGMPGWPVVRAEAVRDDVGNDDTDDESDDGRDDESSAAAP